MFVEIFIVFILSSTELGEHLYDHYFDTRHFFSGVLSSLGGQGETYIFSSFILLDFLWLFLCIRQNSFLSKFEGAALHRRQNLPLNLALILGCFLNSLFQSHSAWKCNLLCPPEPGIQGSVPCVGCAYLLAWLGLQESGKVGRARLLVEVAWWGGAAAYW